MKNLHWRAQTPSRQSVQRGWQALAGWRRRLLVSVVVLLTLFCLWQITAGKLWSGVFLLHIALMVWQILHNYGYPRLQQEQGSIELQWLDGQIWLDDFCLPSRVQKLVIGRIDIAGPAFLQLAWNGGEQWRFPVEQLPTVRHFFRQHAPQITVIEE